jgi:hypothetical protein
VKVYLSRRKLPKSETGKPRWTSLGDMTGRVVRIPSDRPAGKGKQGSDQTKDTQPTLVIAVEEVLLTRFNVPRNQGKVTLEPDVFARKVMILKDAPEEKDSAKK